jgi:hypothetical protein
VVILRSGRSPFELFLLAACVLSGLAGLIAPTSTSSALARLLPTWVVIAWSAGLVIGGAVAIAGVLMRGLTALLVERIGLVGLAGFSVLYSAVIVAEVGIRATFTALFVVAFAGACVGRFWQISQDLRRADVEANRPEPEGGR